MRSKRPSSSSQHRDQQGDDRGEAQRHRADVEGLVGVVGRNDLCTGTKDQLCSVLQEEGHADCRDQQGDTGCVAQRGVGDLLDHNAQQRAGDDGGAHSSDRANNSSTSPLIKD